MKLRATFVFEYDLADNLVDRQDAYGATDPDECARIDQDNDPITIIEVLTANDEIVEHRVEVVKEDAEL